MMPSLEELLADQFGKIKVSPKKHTKNLAHLHADFAEIIALLRNEDIFSRADLINRYKSYEVSPSELDIECENGESEAEKDDAYTRWADQLFMILSDRQSIYGDSYPFEVDLTSIKLIDSTLILDKKKIYLVLLLCANLNFFCKSLRSILTSEFEYISYLTLKNYVSSTAEVRQFGKRSDYSGSAQVKIKALASDMMGIEINDREFNKILGTQERGLDVVAWYPFTDKYSSFIAILGQCACGKNWYSKLNETKRFQNYFRFEKLNPIHALFAPGALFSKAVDADGDFFQSDEFHDVLFFERFRILEYIEGTDFTDDLDSNKIVDFAINYEEDLV